MRVRGWRLLPRSRMRSRMRHRMPFRPTRSSGAMMHGSRSSSNLCVNRIELPADLAQMTPMKHFDITYHGETVTLADLPEYRKFYAKLGSGQWEPRTFRALSDQLDHDVTYIDIGGWIGVTPFWASRRAKRVLVVE